MVVGVRPRSTTRYLIDWHGIGLRDQGNVTDSDRRVYTSWYDDPDTMQHQTGSTAVHGHRRHEDLRQGRAAAGVDRRHVAPLIRTLPATAADIRGIITVDEALHWLCEEDPDLVTKSLLDFLV